MLKRKCKKRILKENNRKRKEQVLKKKDKNLKRNNDALIKKKNLKKYSEKIEILYEINNIYH